MEATTNLATGAICVQNSSAPEAMRLSTIAFSALVLYHGISRSRRLIELSFGWLIIRADSEHTRSKKNSTIGTGIIVLAPLNLCTLHLKKTPALKAVLKDYLEDEHRAALSIRRDCTRRSVALPSRCMETDQGACNGLWIGPESQSQTETWSPRQSKKMQRAVGRQASDQAGSLEPELPQAVKPAPKNEHRSNCWRPCTETVENLTVFTNRSPVHKSSGMPSRIPCVTKEGRFHGMVSQEEEHALNLLYIYDVKLDVWNYVHFEREPGHSCIFRCMEHKSQVLLVGYRDNLGHSLCFYDLVDSRIEPKYPDWSGKTLFYFREKEAEPMLSVSDVLTSLQQERDKCYNK
ncbi:hypothetical protein AXG93_40s1250 [Marchantia polymorpha subsp. ruderalis]|uniref:Uncharacterized protein n=1 Tax=Marchantia polymorpha subsp. ruderalis TaxID=1480154 RepID=A0A176WEN4_MARPO|nr:hypothetical protein AXG93_40s1250 [Marchantia polymorpha subsp. ruderalis]